MFKKLFLHAILASVLAAIAAIIYRQIYFFATEVDFSTVLNLGRLIGLSLFICLLAALINYGVMQLFKKRSEIIFNFLFSILTFAGVIIPISISLPLNVKYPELFPGLAVPMIFFPAIAWYTLNPLLKYG